MDANQSSRQVARNAAASYLTLVAHLVSGLVVTPILLRELGTSAFGTYALITMMVSYVGLLELGVGTATIRLVARSAATKSGPPIHDVLGSSRALLLLVAGTSAVAFIAVAALTPLMPGASGATAAEVRLAIVALSMGQLFTLLMNVYPAYIFGIGRGDVLYGLGAGFSITLSAAQAVVAISGGGVVLLAVATAAVGVANAAVISVLARRMLQGARARLRHARRGTMRQMLSVGVKNAVVNLTATMNQYLDVFIVGAFLSARSVAAYAVASRVAMFIRTIATRAADVLLPTFADAAARRDEDRQFRLVVEASLLGAAVLYPFLLVSLLFGYDLLQLWLGEVPPDSETVLVLLVGAAAATALGHVGFVFFNGRGELDFFVRVGTVVAVANLVASIALTPLIGVTGPALASVAAFVVWDTLLIPRAVAAQLNRSSLDLFRAVLGPLVVPLIAACATGATLRIALTSDPGGAAAAAATLVVFYVVLVGSMGSSRRRSYIRLIRREPASE